jgi:adenine deaminase
MFRLAERNSVRLPFAGVEQVLAAYQFTNLQSFLDLYYQGTAVLQSAEDFCELTTAYFRRAAAQGLRHAEVFFDPQSHTDRGLRFEIVLEGILAGLREAQTELGISSRLILSFLRHLSAERAMQALRQALPHREHFIAVGLDSSEVGNPPSKFTAVFDEARRQGFLTVAHAGEEGPAAYIAEALDLLHTARIDHGVRCLDDPALVARLAREQIPLTVCPLSNVRLRVCRTMAEHPLRRLMEAGLLVTVNSDDPAYFGGYVADNYQAVHDDLGVDRVGLAQIARNSFAASFLPPADRARHLRDVDAFVALSEP